ncbi:MAG: hypothetical protein FWF72_01765 [Paludibacter sp.]|nr:hypothetical protein [Paludibacter sp.]
MYKVKKPNPLADYLGKVPSQFYNGKVEEIKKGCGIDRNTFRNWVSGQCRVPPPGQILINQILNKKIFDV